MKVKEAMSKDAAMSVLGLKLTTEGKNKKAIKLTDYSEEELLVAFRETCAVIGSFSPNQEPFGVEMIIIIIIIDFPR